jgi:GNAT superfamily N-acetyltransferase
VGEHLVAVLELDAEHGVRQRLDDPLGDNLHSANVAVEVAGPNSGLGVGRTLLEHVEAIARSRGRSTFIARTASAGDLDGTRDAQFAHSAGYVQARRDARRLLALDEVIPKLDGLEAASAPYAMGYELVTWRGACPDPYVAGRVRLARAMSNDAPRGDLELETQEWDEARLRTWEQLLTGGERTLLVAGAVERATGELVAVTEIGTPIGDELLAHQFLTVVEPEHRGHRLGMLVKLANLRELVASSGAATKVVTWNASENAAMIRVNEALGCVRAGGGVVWQKRKG